MISCGAWSCKWCIIQTHPFNLRSHVWAILFRKINNTFLANLTMTYCWKIFRMIISKIELWFYSFAIKFSSYMSITKPIILYIPSLDLFCVILFLMKFSVVLLSTIIGVGCCECPSCCNTYPMSIAVWALWKTAAISHSADAVTTWRRVLHLMCIGAFCVVVFALLDERKHIHQFYFLHMEQQDMMQQSECEGPCHFCDTWDLHWDMLHNNLVIVDIIWLRVELDCFVTGL